MLASQKRKGLKTFQIISHRGLCNVFPENTKEAIVGALQFSDLAELDILVTKDSQVIVFHDRTLNRLTNASEFPEFQAREKEQAIEENGKLKKGLWLRDFTLQELRQLKVTSSTRELPQTVGRNYSISTMEEIFEACLEFKSHNPSNESGLLIELKEEVQGEVSPSDRIMCKKLVQLLEKFGLNTEEGCRMRKFPVVIQSFNLKVLDLVKGCENQMVQLYDKVVEITEDLLEKNAKMGTNVKGIGITQKNLLDKSGNPSRQAREICDKFGYSLKYWTIIDDSPTVPFGLLNYNDVYLALVRLGVTGFITEFPSNCYNALHQIDSPSQKENQSEKNDSPTC